MSINQMYRTWIRRICELRPGQRITQVRNFVWLVVGIFHSRSVRLSHGAGYDSAGAPARARVAPGL
jgi:hypothetical protein